MNQHLSLTVERPHILLCGLLCFKDEDTIGDLLYLFLNLFLCHDTSRCDLAKVFLLLKLDHMIKLVM